MKIFLCKGGIGNILAFMKFFDCLVKFWTLPYGPKAQWSNSQKQNYNIIDDIQSSLDLLMNYFLK